jgi:hypothetical protein
MANLDNCRNNIRDDVIESDDVRAHRTRQRTAVCFLREGNIKNSFSFPEVVHSNCLRFPKLCEFWVS